MLNQTVRAPVDRFVLLVWAAFYVFAARTYSQVQQETLSGPDSHERPPTERGHLFGDWCGVRPALLERGVTFDLQYISDSLTNVVSDRDDRFVAAFDFFGGRWRGGRGGDTGEPVASATVAYIVRAVTPGTFVHPAATVEDMYRPTRYARTSAGRLEIAGQ